ncbi:histidine kinase dimerization/phospho-acceptor domain-containing protein, partial [Amycolatopsis mediterranei]
MARILPRSTRWRVALFAALASAVVLGLGSYWFVRSLRSGLDLAAVRVANEKVAAIAGLLEAGVSPTEVAGQLNYGGYRISLGKGKDSGCPERLDQGGTVVGKARVLGPGCVVGMPFPIDGGIESVTGTKGGKYFVQAQTALDPVGLETVANAEQLLWGGVPAAALFIGGVAWFAVRRSLRAVGALRAEVDGIRARDLGRRVPVPDSGDEITELAVTMNAMLARLDRSVQRQSQFTADASHELRTPLASMRTQLEVQLAHPDRLDWRHSFENAVLDVSRMETLTGDLLLLSKLDIDQPAGSTRIALADLLTEHLAARLPRDGVEVRTEIRADPVVQG